MSRLQIEKHFEYDRDMDGNDIIAISSRGRTLLGRGLAVGALLPSEHPDYGSFKSMAGFIRFVCGDRRELMREIFGVQYDEAIFDPIPPSYEEVIQDQVVRVLAQGQIRGQSLHQGLLENTLPLSLYQDVDGELHPVKMPTWFIEALERLLKRTPVALESPAQGFQWDASEFDPPPPATPEEARRRSLRELQAEYLRIHEGTDAEIDFWVSQPEYDSIPEAIRKQMGTTLKIQAVLEGKHNPAPPKKIM